MPPVFLRAISQGYLAFERLSAAKNGVLRRHSAFRHTLNLLLDDGLLLPLISANRSANHPDALRVQVPECWDWRQSAEVKLEYGSLIASNWQCVIDDLPIWRPAITPVGHIPAPTLPFLHQQLRLWRQQHRVESVLKLLPDDASGVQIDIAPDHSEVQLADMADRIIGFGGGLTPDGDDYLVGYFAAIGMSRRPLCCLHRQRLAAAVTPRLARTNDISRHYLGRAVQGHFSESINTLLAQISAPFCPSALAKCATEVMDFGASSGADCMAGLLHGLRNLHDSLRC